MTRDLTAPLAAPLSSLMSPSQSRGSGRVRLYGKNRRIRDSLSHTLQYSSLILLARLAARPTCLPSTRTRTSLRVLHVQTMHLCKTPASPLLVHEARTTQTISHSPGTEHPPPDTLNPPRARPAGLGRRVRRHARREGLELELKFLPAAALAAHWGCAQIAPHRLRRVRLSSYYRAAALSCPSGSIAHPLSGRITHGPLRP